jgi:hypothetical protein
LVAWSLALRGTKINGPDPTAVCRLHRVPDPPISDDAPSDQAPADAAALLGHTVAVHLSTYVPLTEKGARTAASGLGAAIAGVV